MSVVKASGGLFLAGLSESGAAWWTDDSGRALRYSDSDGAYDAVRQLAAAEYGDVADQRAYREYVIAPA